MLKKFILLLLLSTSLLFSFTKDEIESKMKTNINNVLSILKNNTISKEEKGQKIISIMDQVFDYTLMSRLSLGRQWASLSKDKQEEFTVLFTQTLKKSYLNKLDLYTDQKIEFLGTQEPKKNRLVFKTLLIGEKENFDINYKFYPKTKDVWKIYDIDLIGVSIIQTYRQQFAGFLKDKSFDQLIENLNNKK